MRAKAANRYAKALLDAAIEQEILEKTKEDMAFIQSTILSSPELRLFLKSPIVKKEQKKAALLAIFDKKIGDLSINLLNLLSQKGRENLLEDIAANFHELYNQYHGIIEVDVVSALGIEKNQLTSLTKKLENITGKKVNVTTSVKEDLIGGMLVRIDDTVIDGTVKHKLNALKDRFTSASVE